MSSTAILKSIRDALVETEGMPAVYVAGSVPGRPALPYIILSVLPASNNRIATDATQGLDGVQVDAIAPTLAAASDLADAATSTVLGLGSVSVTEGGVPTGLERASGTWRVVFPADPATEGDRAQRVAVLFNQIEFRG